MGVRSFLVARRWLSVGTTLVLAALTVVTSPAMAAASGPAPETMGPAPHSVGASQMTLAQAPIGLRVAVRLALGRSSGSRQQAKLTASDGAALDDFGWFTAISGSTAVVGSPFKNSNTGAAYVFVRSGTAWSQQAKLTASDPAANDFFGFSVATTGSTAVVGAWRKDNQTGAAYVFVRSGTAWSQRAKLTASDGAAGDNFGFSVAISGSTVVVGASGPNDLTGAAYVFVRSETAWTQRAKLTASDGAAFDQFGFSVAISGSTVVVGAFGPNEFTGAAYVFVRSGTAWSQRAKLTASDGAAFDQFGFSVAISGSTAVVGAIGSKSSTGAAYVFARSGTTWSQQAKLTDAHGAVNDNFGYSVAISGSTAVVGSPFKNSNTGAAYVFARSGTAWPRRGKLTASDRAKDDFFGFSVAISDSAAVVGAWGKNLEVGAAYVYVLP